MALANLSSGRKSIDLEDLIPAQVAGVMFLIQFGIVSLTAYEGAINLEQTYAVAGIEFSLAFVVSSAAFVTIVVTNELKADDVMFWEDAGKLDQIYGAAIALTAGLLVGVEFSTYVNDLVTGSDVIGTVAFFVSVVAIWAIVWVR